jgi:hypothetical protein
VIVQVQHPADGGCQTVVIGCPWTQLKPSLPAQTRPAAAASPVDVVKVQPSLLKEFAEWAVADSAQLRDKALPVNPKR